MTQTEIEGKLLQIVKETLGIELSDEDRKKGFDSLGISSFAMVQLVCEIEESFDMDIPNSDIQKIKNFEQAVKYLAKHS